MGRNLVPVMREQVPVNGAVPAVKIFVRYRKSWKWAGNTGVIMAIANSMIKFVLYGASEQRQCFSLLSPQRIG